MDSESHFVCQKSFSGTAATGITFHWLKCAFGENFKDAVSTAVCIIHLSAALADSMDSSESKKFIAALEWSQRKFDRWMDIALHHRPMRKPITRRVLVDFALPFDSSNIGVTLAWLAKDKSRSLTQHVLDAVLLVFRPVALAALKDPSLELAILCSRTVFAHKTDLPGYTSSLSEISKVVVEPRVKPTILLNPSQSSSVEAQRPDVPLGESALAQAEIAPPPNGAKVDYTPDIDMDFDF